MATPDIRLPSIDGLRAFDAAARLGSFERAADELNITASAVSKRLGTLEELLGVTLFNRSGKTLALSAAGQEYLEQVRAALGLLAAMPPHRRAAQRLERLRVSSPPTFARQILVPRLDAFTLANPTIVLSIPYLNSAASDADIEVRHGDPAALGGTPLLHDVVLPVAAPSLLARLPTCAMPRCCARRWNRGRRGSMPPGWHGPSRHRAGSCSTWVCCWRRSMPTRPTIGTLLLSQRGTAHGTDALWRQAIRWWGGQGRHPTLGRSLCSRLTPERSIRQVRRTPVSPVQRRQAWRASSYRPITFCTGAKVSRPAIHGMIDDASEVTRTRPDSPRWYPRASR